MKLDGKLLFDYQTLLDNPRLLEQFPNSLLLLPYSNFCLINDTLEAFSEDESISQEEKDNIIPEFIPFLDFIFSFPNLLEQIVDEKKLQSNAIFLDRLNNVFFNFTGNFDTSNKFNLPEEVVNDIYVYNVICASIEFDCPIFTTNQDLINLIKKYNLPVDFITVD